MSTPSTLRCSPAPCGRRTSRLDEMGLSFPVRRHWRLNERHYGALPGGTRRRRRDEIRA